MRRYIIRPADQKGFVKQWLNVKDDVEGKEGNKRYTLSKVLDFHDGRAQSLPVQKIALDASLLLRVPQVKVPQLSGCI